MKCEHTEGKGHDCQYIDMCNSYIPEAEKIANKTAKRKDDADWNRIFHWELARLSRQIRKFYYYESEMRDKPC